MIISYLHKYIFIKTKKTAGTTVEAVLARSCGPDDVVTMEIAEKDGGLVTRNIYIDPDEEAARRERQGKARRRRVRGERQAARRSGAAFYNHMRAEIAYNLIDRKFWDQAFKFTTERHPYEKVVSLTYYMLEKKGGGRDFNEFLDHVVRKGSYLGFRHWSIGGKVAVDDFVRQENLKADLDRIGLRLGIPIPDELPERKMQTRVDRRPAHDVLTDEQKAVVYERCAPEFEVLCWER